MKSAKTSLRYIPVLTLLIFATVCSSFAPIFLTKKISLELSVHRDPLRMPTSTPMVPYKAPGSDYAQFIDIYSRMFRDRILYVRQYIDNEAANQIISTILYLRKEDSTGPITLYLNVPGADLRPALALYDLIVQTRQNCEITTVNLALCTGMGAFLCSAGTKGRRCAMPNSRFLLYRTGLERPFEGQASDIGLEVANIKKANDRMEMELSKLTGQPVTKICEDLKRDFYLSSDEAVRYGLIDKVLMPAPRKRSTTGKDVDLGAFEGDDVQKFQNQKGGKSGYGSGWRDASSRGNAGGSRKGDDDYEPPIIKQ